METAAKRIPEIIKLLRKKYHEPRTALNYNKPFELLVATILSAQSTDVGVNKVTPALFMKYRTIEDFAGAKKNELEQLVHSTGFFRNKSKNIIGAADTIMKNFNGKVPDNMADLITLPGVARKTANILLSSYYKKAEGIAVDTHVRRLSQRMGLTKEEDPNKIEIDLMELVPKKDWLDFNYLFVNHGRETCQAKKPMCPQCVVKNLCPSARKFFPNL